MPFSTKKKNNLLISGPFLAVETQRFGGGRELATVQHIAADHDSGAALACLAVHRGYVPLVLGQPLVHVIAEWTDVFDTWWVVVVERVVGYSLLKLVHIVRTLRAPVQHIYL